MIRALGLALVPVLAALPASAEWFVQHLAPSDDAVMAVVDRGERAMTNAYVDDAEGAHRLEVSCAPDGEFLGLSRIGRREPFLGGPEASASVSFDGGDPKDLGVLRHVGGEYFAPLPAEIREGIVRGRTMTLALDPGGTLQFTLASSSRALGEMKCYEG